MDQQHLHKTAQDLIDRYGLGFSMRSHQLPAVEDYHLAVATDNGGNLTGILPYTLQQGKVKRVTNPKFGQFTPLLFFYPEGMSRSRRFSFEQQVIEELLSQLPKVDHLVFQFEPGFKQLLPFKWYGFNTDVRYTFILEDCSNLDQLKAQCRPNVRNNLKQAQQQLSVESSTDFELLFELYTDYFQQHNIRQHYSKDDFIALSSMQQNVKNGTLLMARDQNSPAAMAYFIWDKHYVYYLIGAQNTALKNSTALTALIWEGLQLAYQKDLAFNFEGSMVPTIARFFSAFGAAATPYYVAERYDNKLLKLYREKSL